MEMLVCSTSNTCCAQFNKSQAKFDKKLKNAQKASHIVSICVRLDGKCPVVEEMCKICY